MERLTTQKSDGMPFKDRQSDMGDFLVKVRRKKVLGCLRFVWRSKRRFVICEEEETVSYERERRGWRIRPRKQEPLFTVKMADVVTIRWVINHQRKKIFHIFFVTI